MKSYLLLKSLFLAGVLATLYSCQKPPKYDNKPHIEFKDVEVYPSLEMA